MDLPVPNSVKQSVNEQMVFAIIPFADLFASFRVEKFRIYALVTLGMLYMDYSLYDFIGDAGSVALYVFVFIPIAVYLMRLWTIKWNAKMELEQEESKPIRVDTVDDKTTRCERCNRMISNINEQGVCNSCQTEAKKIE